MTLRTALLFQDGNFVGREYFCCLDAAGMPPDLAVAVGRMPDASIEIERKRTAGRWNPPLLATGQTVHRFESLESPALWQALRDARIDVAIQGGIGILKPEMLCAPRIGFINVHPGRLPQYRGNSCLEWALYNKDDIYATAHLIDEGIDTGPVICEGRYEIESGWDYHDLRSHLYAHCGKVLVRALQILDGADDPASVLTPQNKSTGHYWQPIPQEKLEVAIAHMR